MKALLTKLPSLGDVRKELAKRDYYEYVKYTHRRLYTYTRHGEFIANTLNEAVERRAKMKAGEIPLETQYFMFNLPPQHGKSMHITETFPSYFLGKFSDEGVIEISYNESFASKFGSRNRDKITTCGEELFGISISKDTNSKGEWEIINAETGEKTRGGMISRGIMSGITGSSLGDCIIIDDPIKNREEANSETIRQKHWDEWNDSIFSRIHPGAIVIIIMTRWHEDDLCGRLLNPEYGPVLPWKRINLPLECDEKHIVEEGNPLNRELGEPLWPERYGKGFIAERKSFQLTFNSLYQGRPRAESGNLFKREYFRYFSEQTIGNQQYFVLHGDVERRYRKESLWCFQTVDPANSTKTINDYFVVSTWYVTPEHDLLLYDVYRTHIEGPDQKPLMKEMRGRYRPRFQAVENKTFGTNLIQEMRREGMTVRPVNVDTDKVTRSLVIAARYEVGQVYHRQDAPWLTKYEDELLSFPRGKNDDQVDTASMAGEIIHALPKEEREDKHRTRAQRFDEDMDDDNDEYGGFW